MILLIVDTLTAVYLRPLLMKGLDEAQKQDRRPDRVWADTSAIVTRPDKSQAANEGWDSKLLSGEAWRRSRGFSETDAPDEDETGAAGGDGAGADVAGDGHRDDPALNPEFFDQAAKAGAEESGIPDDISSLLAPAEGSRRRSRRRWSEPGARSRVARSRRAGTCHRPVARTHGRKAGQK